MQWYEDNKRDLPWRNTDDPYLIWVSEVILQQTRVEQGLPYYQRFTERFPDLGSLAAAGEDEVMKIWQGLGYYSRAINMLRSARMICQDRHSEFPASYDEIMQLNGVGDYSASAISSIAYGESRPAVDGNVLRVVARHEGILEPVRTTAGRNKVKEILAGYIDKEQPGIFNQAMMELGAIVCRPKQPLCPVCPVSETCYALRKGVISDLPKSSKPGRSKVSFFNYLVIFSKERNENYIWLKKRTDDDIWKHLYDFFLIETEHECSTDELKTLEEWKMIAGKYGLKTGPAVVKIRHMLTHRELRLKFIPVSSDNFDHHGYLKVSINEIHKYPIPRPVENFLKKVALRPGIFFNFPD
jgi:A/G-specific adenine glycosylase